MTKRFISVCDAVNLIKERESQNDCNYCIERLCELLVELSDDVGIDIENEDEE